MKKFNIKFYENRKIYFGITIALFAIGIIFNIIFGTTLDIQFKGGAMLDYTYTGEISTSDVESIVEEVTGQNVDIRVYSSMVDTNGANTNGMSITFAGTDSITVDQQDAISSAILEKYPDSALTIEETSSVDRTVGTSFFAKCLIAVAIAFVLLVIYIAFRFRKIGGASAGIISIIALLHDVLLVYFTFVIFRMPINDNFIAVILTILGYSLNNTIIIYDRIRENRRALGPKAQTSELVNLSINQTLTRSIYTSLCTFVAIGCVYVVGMAYGLTSVTTFALPMMVGILVGCYSSVCITGPLYVMWRNYKDKTSVKAK
ncbi:protein translocase subunit SecF [Anaeromassilibacillus sp. An200]|uniref:Protein-export membrane protein SecF n=1 Tax=Candidatus Caccousia stercoris TaxID=2840723 RepID=A0A9D1K3C7_9FIRM|nr:protein translocase subunit SecF [Anaeromassilibacillus sp. An200]OUP10792.1 protein translocase subunit SecF [Anaeromassilibacillus sp. An200]HIS79792.1 protein translocase subunit SecF [Candidatus Caccousia stercoris]